MNLDEARTKTSHIKDAAERADAISELLVEDRTPINARSPNEGGPLDPIKDDPDFPAGSLVQPRRHEQGSTIGVVVGLTPDKIGDVLVEWQGASGAIRNSIDGLIRVDQGILYQPGETVVMAINGKAVRYQITDASRNSQGAVSLHLSPSS